MKPIRALELLLLAGVFANAACSGGLDPSRDGAGDATSDGTRRDAAVDTPASDTSGDDMNTDDVIAADVTIDAGIDGGLDAGIDAALDSGPRDTGRVDTGTDASGDTGVSDSGRTDAGGADASDAGGVPPVSYGTTYYVRTDGGDATQCTGLADAPYPGSGSARACAWSSPEIALPPSGTARIRGSDTLVIGPGTYTVGTRGYLQPVPSGATATTRTRILGQNCATPPTIAGTGMIHRVLNLDGSSNVEIGCLEITDRSDCVYGHSDATIACRVAGGTTGDANYSRVGVYARASTNAWLHDLNVHGISARGFQAGALRDWTVERVRMNRNGTAGWDANVGTGVSSNAGNMVFRDIEIGWNGCGERSATGAPYACWAQLSGGYGDGFGTTDTAGVWLFEDAYIHHNTSDGLDLRYMDGADGTRVTLRRIHSVANAGNQIKVRGNAVIENSVMVGQCTYFRGQFYIMDAELCRAYGTSLLLVLTGNDDVIVRHNTITGEGDAQIAYTTESGSGDRISIRNNAILGFTDFRGDRGYTLFHGGDAPVAPTFSGNLGYHVRSCPTSGSICGTDPTFTNMTLANFDGVPLAGSPLIDAAPVIAAVTDDFLQNPRPAGSAPDIGAYEVQP